MTHQEMAEESRTTVRTIKKWLVEKHRMTKNLRKELKTLTKLQQNLIIGSMLGDGHITNEKYLPIFIVSHAHSEKDYLFWKYETLKDVCNKPPTFNVAKLKPFGNKLFMAQKSYRINTRSLDALIAFRDMSIIELVNSLNEFSLSIWMLDDGHRSSISWELCVAPYEDSEIIHILKVFHEVFGLSCKRKSDPRYITFTSDSSRKLDEIILSHIPNQLDIIKKKITENNISQAANYFWIEFNGEMIGLNRFCRTNKIPYSKGRDLYMQGITDGNAIIESIHIK